MRFFLIVLILTLSCTPPPTSSAICDSTQDDQNGEFEILLNEISGGCGYIGKLDVVLEDGVIYPDEGLGCTAPEISWYGDMCKTRSTFKCDDGRWKTEMIWSVITYPEDNDRIYGSLKTTMDLLDAFYVCESTYHMEGSRQ